MEKSAEVCARLPEVGRRNVGYGRGGILEVIHWCEGVSDWRSRRDQLNEAPLAKEDWSERG
jgi:hypothetical protein